jgi:hypothetical protein
MITLSFAVEVWTLPPDAEEATVSAEPTLRAVKNGRKIDP